MVVYPTLISEMSKREITKKSVAQCIGVCQKTLQNKLNGKSPFTWAEVKTIQHQFFPDMDPDILFADAEDGRTSV